MLEDVRIETGLTLGFSGTASQLKIWTKCFLPPLGLTVITRCVICEAVEDEYLSPLGTLIQSCQQLVDGLRVQVQQIAVGVRLCYLRQSCHRIGYNLKMKSRDTFVNSTLLNTFVETSQRLSVKCRRTSAWRLGGSLASGYPAHKSRTMGLESEMRSLRVSRKPWSSTNWALMSCSFATHTAAVFLTYGSSSFRHFLRGSHRYSVILSTRMQPIVRTAKARIRGLGSSQS